MGPFKMVVRMLIDLCYFMSHLFMKVGDEAIAEEEKIAYLNLSEFEMIEEIIEDLGGAGGGKVPFRNIIKALQSRMHLFQLLKA